MLKLKWEYAEVGNGFVEYWQPTLRWKISQAFGGGWLAERGDDESFLPESYARDDLSALMELCEVMTYEH
jgi:hypothetical protein